MPADFNGKVIRIWGFEPGKIEDKFGFLFLQQKVIFDSSSTSGY
jgi:hypothetical protein